MIAYLIDDALALRLALEDARIAREVADRQRRRSGRAGYHDAIPEGYRGETEADLDLSPYRDAGLLREPAGVA